MGTCACENDVLSPFHRLAVIGWVVRGKNIIGNKIDMCSFFCLSPSHDGEKVESLKWGTSAAFPKQAIYPRLTGRLNVVFIWISIAISKTSGFAYFVNTFNILAS